MIAPPPPPRHADLAVVFIRLDPGGGADLFVPFPAGLGYPPPKIVVDPAMIGGISVELEFFRRFFSDFFPDGRTDGRTDKASNKLEGRRAMSRKGFVIRGYYSRLGAVAATVAEMIDRHRGVQVRLIAPDRVRQLKSTPQVVPPSRLAAQIELARPPVHVSPLERVT